MRGVMSSCTADAQTAVLGLWTNLVAVTRACRQLSQMTLAAQ